MSKINTRDWRAFQISDLFEIVKGKRLTKAAMTEGKIRFIGASAINNGITAFISNKEHLHPSNTITVSYNGSVGEAFYQDEIFWASDDVNVLYPKFEMNEYIAMFIIPILKKAGKKYKFIDKWKKEDMEKDCIILPADQTGRPDFSYMETYMKNRAVAVSSALTALQSAQKLDFFKRLDIKDWAEFRIGELFDVKRPTTRSQANYSEGTVPFVASGNYNNGVLKYLQPNKDESLEQGGCITVSPVDGSAFYQEKPFLGRGGAGSSIILLYNATLDLYSGYFIATVIRSVCSKYAYGDMANKETIGNEVIKLPANDRNEPDYKFMSDYMAHMLGKTSQTLLGLRTFMV